MTSLFSLVPGAPAPASAPNPSDLAPTGARGVRLLEVESARGRRYAGWVLLGDVPFRPWVAKTLNRVASVVFEDEP